MAGGRPTKYDPLYHPEHAFKYSLMGATLEKLAEFFEVHVDTIKEWKNVHEEFSAAIKKGKEDADAEVVKSLYKRATGYDVTEVTYEKIESKDQMGVDADGELSLDEAWKKKMTVKHIVPDTAAAFIWMKNRRPGEWRDKVQTELTGPDGGPIQTQTEHVIKFEGMGKKKPDENIESTSPI